MLDGPLTCFCAPGALEQYVVSLELVNRKLPFGLAETGLCYQLPEDQPGELDW